MSNVLRKMTTENIKKNNCNSRTTTTTTTAALATTATSNNNRSTIMATINSSSSNNSTSNSAVDGIAAGELSEIFYINNKRRNNNLKIQVKLNSGGIYLRRETEQHDHITEQLIRIEDIVGSRCGPRLRKGVRGGLASCKRLNEDNDDGDGDTQQPQPPSTTPKDAGAYLYIYAYILREKPLRRTRTVRILHFCSHQYYEDNFKSAQRWHRSIIIHKHGDLNMAINRKNGLLLERKPLLILLNPKSGSGKGRVMFQKQVVPVLKEAEMPYDLMVTTHANFARELVRTRRDLLQRYSGIVVAAGDGLFYEVLNGLMERTDWLLTVQHLPLGIIPCGSGNGLAKSIAHLYDEPYEPKPIQNATLCCVSGQTALMDIVRVELGNGATMYSFLSIGWGLIADVDIESEPLRSIGAPRFTLWSVHRVLNLRTYKGKLSYLPWRKEESIVKATAAAAAAPSGNPHIQEQTNVDTTTLPNEEFHDFPADENDSVSTIAPTANNQNVCDEGDEFNDAISLDASSFRPHTDSWHSAMSRRTAYYSIAGHSIRSRRSMALNMAVKIEAANSILESADQPPRTPAHTIPPLNLPVPSETWHCENGEYVMVQAAYTTHLAADCLFAPESQLNDGIIYLIIIRAGVGRTQVAQFLLSLSTGTHLPTEPNAHIEVVPVRAFRIEPCKDGREGIITVDGERVDYGAIQGEVLPGMINVMVPHNHTK